MLFFESFYDDFMILGYDKVCLAGSENVLFRFR